jgi:hypothetical protein
MSVSQPAFIHQQNIRHYEQELSITPVGPRRKMLLLLMARERASAVGKTSCRRRHNHPIAPAVEAGGAR